MVLSLILAMLLFVCVMLDLLRHDIWHRSPGARRAACSEWGRGIGFHGVIQVQVYRYL